MSRREVERRKFRQALVPGLALSAVAHLALLGLAVLEVPAREESDPNRERQERAEERREKSLEIVTVRPRPDRAAASRPAGASPAARPSATAAADAAAPAVGAPSARRVATEPVDVPSVVVAVRTEEREERLSASDLAALFPGRSETPRPTSRAAREASGDPGTAGDGFRGVAGTQRAGRRGGGCVVRPGTAINRRFPEGITIGGG